MKNALDKNIELQECLANRSIHLDAGSVAKLRRAEMTLHRWAEQECGDGNDYCSWAIERDEETGIPYRVTYPHNGPSRREKIPDREKGALVTVAKICTANGLHYYQQTDPRGCSLYVGKERLDAQNYSARGVACCVS